MKYIIHETYYSLSSGCDCCEPDLYESYSIIGLDGRKLGYVDDCFGFHEYEFCSRQDALEFLLNQRDVEIEYTYEGVN